MAEDGVSSGLALVCSSFAASAAFGSGESASGTTLVTVVPLTAMPGAMLREMSAARLARNLPPSATLATWPGPAVSKGATDGFTASKHTVSAKCRAAPLPKARG